MGEKMRHAPVYFTIVQVRHNPVSKLAEFSTDIQEKMRQTGYPDFKRDSSVSFTFELGPIADPTQKPLPIQVERLHFYNAQRTAGFVIEENAVSFQTSAYETFEAFSTEFLKGVRLVHEVLSLAYVDRLGLRYLDAVVPPENTNEGLARYLVPGVLGIAANLPDDPPVMHSVSETRFAVGNSVVLARTIIQKGLLGFPIDLQPAGFEIEERFKSINDLHAIIDTDAAIERRTSFDLAAIENELIALHDNVWMAFKAITTEEATKAWRN